MNLNTVILLIAGALNSLPACAHKSHPCLQEGYSSWASAGMISSNLHAKSISEGPRAALPHRHKVPGQKRKKPPPRKRKNIRKKLKERQKGPQTWTNIKPGNFHHFLAHIVNRDDTSLRDNVLQHFDDSEIYTLAVTNHYFYFHLIEYLKEKDPRNLADKVWPKGLPKGSTENFLFNRALWHTFDILLAFPSLHDSVRTVILQQYTAKITNLKTGESFEAWGRYQDLQKYCKALFPKPHALVRDFMYTFKRSHIKADSILGVSIKMYTSHGGYNSEYINFPLHMRYMRSILSLLKKIYLGADKLMKRHGLEDGKDNDQEDIEQATDALFDHEEFQIADFQYCRYVNLLLGHKADPRYAFRLCSYGFSQNDITQFLEGTKSIKYIFSARHIKVKSEVWDEMEALSLAAATGTALDFIYTAWDRLEDKICLIYGEHYIEKFIQRALRKGDWEHAELRLQHLSKSNINYNHYKLLVSINLNKYSLATKAVPQLMNTLVGPYSLQGYNLLIAIYAALGNETLTPDAQSMVIRTLGSSITTPAPRKVAHSLKTSSGTTLLKQIAHTRTYLQYAPLDTIKRYVKYALQQKDNRANWDDYFLAASIFYHANSFECAAAYARMVLILKEEAINSNHKKAAEPYNSPWIHPNSIEYYTALLPLQTLSITTGDYRLARNTHFMAEKYEKTAEYARMLVEHEDAINAATQRFLSQSIFKLNDYYSITDNIRRFLVDLEFAAQSYYKIKDYDKASKYIRQLFKTIEHAIYLTKAVQVLSGTFAPRINNPYNAEQEVSISLYALATEVLLSTGDYNKAATFALRILSHLRRSSGDYNEATIAGSNIPNFKILSLLRQSFLKGVTTETNLDIYYYSLAARALLEGEKWVEAEECVEKLLSLRGKNAKWDDYSIAANVFFKRKNYRRAAKITEHLIKYEEEKDITSILKLGAGANYKLGNTERAKELFTSFLNHFKNESPDDEIDLTKDTLRLAIKIYLKTNEKSKAQEYAHKLLDKLGNEATRKDYKLAATAFAAAGEYDSALQNMDKATDLDEGETALTREWQKIRWLHEQGQFERARQDFDALIEQEKPSKCLIQ